MKANAVFIHQRHPRAALQVAHNQFVAIETKHSGDIRIQDQISGDLAMNKLNWCFNITRDTLIHIQVLGQFRTLRAAIDATVAPV
ncbi:MAG: hypothetical protein HY943_20900 [Gammaproteobacteria bacterium]|nr:hypothetical protein [Gammaproteobacteria bacterium]